MAITVGYRFRPTDKELVTHYLFNKLFGQRGPFNDLEYFLVKEGDLYGSLDPWDIWRIYGGDTLKDDRPLYFFTRVKKVSANGSRICRRVGSGTWVGEASGEKILSGNDVVGFKKRFRYENPEYPDDDGAWIMHEFAINPSMLRQQSDIVLCRMKKNPVAEKKKRKLKQLTMSCNNISDELCMSSKRSKLVEPPWPVPISVQQQQADTGPMVQVLQSETEPVDAELMCDSQELFYGLEIGQFQPESGEFW